MTLRSLMFATIALVVTFLFCPPATAHAQDISNLYMAGGSYSAGANPAFAFSGLYAKQASPDTAPGLYMFSAIDVLPNTVKPFTVTTNVGVGVAERVATIAGVPIFVPTSAGISLTGSNVGWAWSTGAGAPFKLGKPRSDGSSWYVMPTVRVLKSSVSNGTGYQPIVGLLFGWGSK